MATELKWLEDDFQNYGAVQIDITEPVEETLTLKSLPEVVPKEKITIKNAFQVDTSIVLLRMKKAIWPLKSENFFENSQIDLYSPFWITTTLVLAISATSALQNHTVSILISSATMLYSLVLIVPGILYCLLSHNGSGIEYYGILSIYGYSLIHFLIPAIFSIFLH